MNGNLTQDKQSIEKKFNEYFTTVGSDLAKYQLSQKRLMIILMEFIKTLFLAPATIDEIKMIIEKF